MKYRVQWNKTLDCKKPGYRLNDLKTLAREFGYDYVVHNDTLYEVKSMRIMGYLDAFDRVWYTPNH